MSKEIVKASPGELVVPDFLKNVTGNQGFENVTREDITLPQLRVCQSLSPQRKRGSTKFIEGLEEGNLFNTISQRVYGERIEVIPLVLLKAPRIYFRDIKEGGGILCRSFNGVDGGTISETCAACPNSKWGANNQQPACTLFYTFPCVLAGSRELIAVALKSTGVAVAKQWITRMEMEPLAGKPMYAGVYEIRTQEQQGKKGTYFSPVVKLRRIVTQDEFTFAARQYESIKTMNVKVELEEETEREPGDEQL